MTKWRHGIDIFPAISIWSFSLYKIDNKFVNQDQAYSDFPIPNTKDQIFYFLCY